MTKNYSTRILNKSDEPEIDEVMGKNPYWSRKSARECVARRKFQRRIDAAGKQPVAKAEGRP